MSPVTSHTEQGVSCHLPVRADSVSMQDLLLRQEHCHSLTARCGSTAAPRAEEIESDPGILWFSQSLPASGVSQLPHSPPTLGTLLLVNT